MFFFFKFSIFYLIVRAETDAGIQWKRYPATHLKAGIKDFYKETWDAEIEVPMHHYSVYKKETNKDMDMDSIVLNKKLKIYVRKFSHEMKAKKHLWLISGGPGSSSSGIERALNVKLPDTAIYLMDNRGLDRSHK